MSAPLEHLAVGQFIWVTVGKTQHSAHFLGTNDAGQALVQWENGQTEALEDSSAISTELPSRRGKRSHNGSVKVESSEETVVPEVMSSTSDPAMVLSAPAMEGLASAVPLATTATDTNDERVPDAASSANLPPAFIQSMNENRLDARVKKEGERVILNTVQRLELLAKRAAWVAANTDPNGNPRLVFRRGCSAVGDITTILGGTGCHEWPKTKKTNSLFINENEYYSAGLESFNSFGPQYPGGSGMVEFQPQYAVQEHFHIFAQCSKKPLYRHWHGRQATGGYHYMGIYRKVPPSREEVEMGVLTVVKFSDLPADFQDEVADWYLGKKENMTTKAYKERKDHYASRAEHNYGENWIGLSNTMKERKAMVECLIEKRRQSILTPVESVGYDENLYRALVEANAAKITSTQAGHVEIDPVKLGFPANL